MKCSNEEEMVESNPTLCPFHTGYLTDSHLPQRSQASGKGVVSAYNVAHVSYLTNHFFNNFINSINSINLAKIIKN